MVRCVTCGGWLLTDLSRGRPAQVETVQDCTPPRTWLGNYISTLLLPLLLSQSHIYISTLVACVLPVGGGEQFLPHLEREACCWLYSRRAPRATQVKLYHAEIANLSPFPLHIWQAVSGMLDDITFRSLQVLLPLHHTTLPGIDNTTHLPPHFVTDLAYKVTGERERERKEESQLVGAGKISW